MINIAYAMGTGGGAGQGGGGFSALIPLILMFVIFYFLLIRPQQKKQKEHRNMINDLKKGDKIVTGGGIHGRIIAAEDTTLTVEIAQQIRIKVNRGSVSGLISSSSLSQAKKNGKTN